MNQERNDGLEAISALLRAADDDPDFRRRLERLLELPTFQRVSIVNASVQEMTLRGEPADVRLAFSLLTADEVADQAMRYLARHEKRITGRTGTKAAG
jgi:hypothetical protein